MELYKYEVHENDNNTNDIIEFEHYVKYSRCCQHGFMGEGKIHHCTAYVMSEIKAKISTKQERTKDMLPVAKFINDVYKPAFEKNIYHNPHVKLLSKEFILSSRKIPFEKDHNSIFTCHDWAEAFSVVLNGETQSEHFGWCPKIYLESGTFQFHDAESKEIVEHYSAFSDDAKQHASLSYENFKTQLELLGSNNMNVITKHRTRIYDHTDGCSAQYRSANAIFLMTILSINHGVIIDRMVHAPGHGKGKVDGLAALIKRVLMLCMRNVTRTANDNEICDYQIKPWSHDDKNEMSFVEQAVRICTLKFCRKEAIPVGQKRQK